MTSKYYASELMVFTSTNKSDLVGNFFIPAIKVSNSSFFVCFFFFRYLSFSNAKISVITSVNVSNVVCLSNNYNTMGKEIKVLKSKRESIIYVLYFAFTVTYLGI